MYGNTPFGTDTGGRELSPEERKLLRQDVSSVAARTRELLPSEFIVGSELSDGSNGPRATVAVQPPVGPAVSADYSPGDDITIGDAEREDIAVGLAASAALQVKNAMSGNPSPTAK